MQNDIPYMPSVKNVAAIFEKISQAAQPTSFTLDFLKDLGFASTNDRAFIKMLKFIGFLDQNGKPLDPYRKYLDHKQAKHVLAEQLRIAYDDLFIANKNAQSMQQSDLKGWFRSKTGTGDAVAEKIASTFRTFADLADFSEVKEKKIHKTTQDESIDLSTSPISIPANDQNLNNIGLVYRFEIHLPDTQNIDTYRAIFKALKEELLK